MERNLCRRTLPYLRLNADPWADCKLPPWTVRAHFGHDETSFIERLNCC